MTEQNYEQLREATLAQLPELSNTRNRTIQDAMDAWANFVAQQPFLRMSHQFNQAAMYPYLEEDEGPDWARIDFFGREQIREAWDEDEYQNMLKEKAFIIGHVAFLEEYVFASTDFKDGIAVIHHDDVYATTDLDALVEKELPYFNCSLESLIKALTAPGKA